MFVAACACVCVASFSTHTNARTKFSQFIFLRYFAIVKAQQWLSSLPLPPLLCAIRIYVFSTKIQSPLITECFSVNISNIT